MSASDILLRQGNSFQRTLGREPYMLISHGFSLVTPDNCR